jgi:hypothetical protein
MSDADPGEDNVRTIHAVAVVKSRAWCAWLNMSRFEVEGPCEIPLRSEQAALQEKRIRYVKIKLRLQVAGS